METDTFQDALGKRVRELRTAASLSQDELASAADITAKYLSQLENGHVNPSAGVLRSLAENGLGISLSVLFNFDITAQAAGDLSQEVARLLAGADEELRIRAVAALRAFCGPTT